MTMLAVKHPLDRLPQMKFTNRHLSSRMHHTLSSYRYTQNHAQCDDARLAAV